MYNQNEGSVLLDQPPFNIRTNIQSLSGEKKAVGFFGVVKEQATRWHFNKDQLSYRVEDAFKKACKTRSMARLSAVVPNRFQLILPVSVNIV